MADDKALYEELVKLNRTMTKVGKFIENSNNDTIGGILIDNFNEVHKRVLNHTDESVRDLAKTIKSIDDLKKLEGKGLKESIEVHRKYKDVYDSMGGAIDEVFNKEIKDAGLSLDDMRKSEEELIASREKLIKTIHEESDAIEKSMEVQKEADEERKQSTKDTAKTIKGVIQSMALYVGKHVIDVAKSSAKAGIEITAAQIKDATLLGMTQAELIEAQREYKQTMNSTGLTTNMLGAMMSDTSHGLAIFTGDMKAGGMFVAESARQFSMVGATAGGTIEDFIDKSADTFKDLNAITGSTIEEFGKLNQELLDNADIQSQMIKMEKSRRMGYFQELALQRNRLTEMGLFESEAQAVIANIAELTGQDAKDRIGDAARIEAAMGAMGLGAEGQRAAELVRKGELDASETRELEGYLIAMQKQSATAQQGGLGSELQTQALLKGLNIEKYFGNSSPLAKTILREPGQRDENGKLTADADRDNMDGTLKKIHTAIIQGNDSMSAIFGDGWMGKLGTILGGAAAAAFLASKLTPAVGFAGKAGKGAISGMFKGIATSVTKVAGMVTLAGVGLKSAFAGAAGLISTGFAGAVGAVSGIFGTLGTSIAALSGGIVAAGVGIAGVAGWFAGGKLNDWLNEHKPEIAKDIGGTVNEAVESIKDGSLISDAVDFWGGQISDIFSSDDKETTSGDAVRDMEEDRKFEEEKRKEEKELMEKMLEAANQQARALEKLGTSQEMQSRALLDNVNNNSGSLFKNQDPYRRGLGASPY